MPARTFINQEGTSNKFWTIDVDGAEHTVHFGRLGTDGQVKTKAFADVAKAAASAEKLIAEKLRKGYVEQGTATPPPAAGTPAAAPPSPATPPPTTAAPPPAAAAPPARAATTDGTLASGVSLRPEEWAWATWRPLPDPPGAPEPFDRARAAAAMRQAKSGEYGWRWIWREPPFTGRVTAEEAGAWLWLTQADRHSPSQQAPKMAGYSGAPPTEPFRLALESKLPAGLALAALIELTGPEQVAEWLLADDPGVPAGRGHHHSEPRVAVVHGVRAHLLPRLEPADRERFTDAVRAKLAGMTWPSDLYTYTYPWQLAAQAGLHDELQAVVDAIADDTYTGDTWSDHYHQPQAVVFGLGSAGAVRAAFERLRLRIAEPWHVAGWLAHTETDALGLAGDRIARVTNRDEAEAVTRELARVADPALAPVMLELMRNSKAPAVARAWLAEHPLEATVGLARAFESRARPDAVEYLRARKRGGDDLTAALQYLGDAAAARLRELVLDHEDRASRELTPAEVPTELRSAPKKKLPPWIDLPALPPVVIGDGRLGLADVDALLRLLAAGEPVPDALEETEPFGWALFEAWLAEGAPTKDKWAMLALGALGGDQTAIKLAPMIRAWPGESQHQRAVLGLGVLGQIGTDTALMLLSGIAEKVKFKALQQRAREAMDEIAAAKGMSKAELEDRIVPTCGLDEHGSRTFDFGPRRFEFVLGPGMKPMVRDESGKVRASPPKPGARDDEALATRAVEDFKLLRKQVSDVAKIQALRLEQAMVTQRRWSVEDFERFVVRHPLQRHLARLLVWRDGATTFRVTDELDYADAEDEPVTLDGEIGLVHPLQLSEGELAAWGEQLADYEIVPPFAQLGRPVLDVEPAERGERELTRFKPRKVAAATLVRTLDNLGWHRGQPQDGGLYCLHTKPFPSLGVTAVVEYDGVPIGGVIDWDDQSIERCYVLDTVLTSPDGLGYGFRDRWAKDVGDQLAWGEVDPIVRSEVLADIATVMGKAR